MSIGRVTEFIVVRRPIEIDAEVEPRTVCIRLLVRAQKAPEIRGSRPKMDIQPAGPPEVVLPLHEEQASITKQQFVTGRVRVSRVTHERGQFLNEALVLEQIEIDRTPIGKPIEAMPPIRQEGDVIVIPIVEEILVVERRLVLQEEVRVRRVRTSKNHGERVVLRRQEAVVSRDLLEHPAAAGAADQSFNTNQAG